ncbi:hypothetical protein Taro_024306 [Colocasia esculenta]|uniref:Protein LURP-one-related 8-like n=1 Tax=Colocasia esculenta TaxID=4460 RepID=A0A843VH35_COLES|nr:hypothetical protein [Colocasia esculenta]
MAMATIQIGGREGCALRETLTMIRQCRLGCRRHMGDPRGAIGWEASPSVDTVFPYPYRCSPSAARLTVWCKSLLFNGRGYTVYDDSDGRMVFRVDNYAQNWREEAHLMDSAGNVLLTIRRCRKKLSITNSWDVYEGDHDVRSRLLGGQQRPLFRVTKALGNPSCTVSVVSPQQEAPSAPAYRMSWSRHDERSHIFAGPAGTLLVAEVRRKLCCGGARGELLGKDVLSMEIQPGMDQALVMALVMINNAMR